LATVARPLDQHVRDQAGGRLHPGGDLHGRVARARLAGDLGQRGVGLRAHGAGDVGVGRVAGHHVEHEDQHVGRADPGLGVALAAEGVGRRGHHLDPAAHLRAGQRGAPGGERGTRADLHALRLGHGLAGGGVRVAQQLLLRPVVDGVVDHRQLALRQGLPAALHQDLRLQLGRGRRPLGRGDHGRVADGARRPRAGPPVGAGAGVDDELQAALNRPAASTVGRASFARRPRRGRAADVGPAAIRVAASGIGPPYGPHPEKAESPSSAAPRRAVDRPSGSAVHYSTNEPMK
jgi:hypothetical protein